MANTTQVVLWSGANRWEPGKIKGYLFTIANGKYRSAEPIDEFPRWIPTIQVQQKVLDQIVAREGSFAKQWEEVEETYVE